MASASPQPCIPEFEVCGEFTGNACKHPGNPKWYHFTFCFTNDGDNAVTVEFDEMVINSVIAPSIIPASVSVPSGGLKHCYYVDGGLFQDSANANGSLTFSVNGVSANIPIAVSNTNPCGTGGDPGDNPKGDPVPPNGHSPIGPCGVPGTNPC